MIWPTNNQKLAAATMFTLFFAGNDFAPQTRVNGLPIQEYLQAHFINAFKQVARQLKDLPDVVVGYERSTSPAPATSANPISMPFRMASSWAISPPPSNPCCW